MEFASGCGDRSLRGIVVHFPFAQQRVSLDRHRLESPLRAYSSSVGL